MADLLDILAEQERLLRFESLSLSALRAIGANIERMAAGKGASVYIMIRVNGLEVFSLAMEGASGNNRLWAARKANTAEYYHKSSMRAALENKAKGRVLEDLGLSCSAYALEGGAFPILLSSGLCVGSIAVSGLPSEEDHQMVCSAVAEYLGIAAPSVLQDSSL